MSSVACPKCRAVLEKINIARAYCSACKVGWRIFEKRDLKGNSVTAITDERECYGTDFETKPMSLKALKQWAKDREIKSVDWNEAAPKFDTSKAEMWKNWGEYLPHSSLFASDFDGVPQTKLATEADYKREFDALFKTLKKKG